MKKTALLFLLSLSLASLLFVPAAGARNFHNGGTVVGANGFDDDGVDAGVGADGADGADGIDGAADFGANGSPGSPGGDGTDAFGGSGTSGDPGGDGESADGGFAFAGDGEAALEFTGADASNLHLKNDGEAIGGNGGNAFAGFGGVGGDGGNGGNGGSGGTAFGGNGGADVANNGQGGAGGSAFGGVGADGGDGGFGGSAQGGSAFGGEGGDGISFNAEDVHNDRVNNKGNSAIGGNGGDGTAVDGGVGGDGGAGGNGGGGGAAFGGVGGDATGVAGNAGAGGTAFGGPAGNGGNGGGGGIAAGGVGFGGDAGDAISFEASTGNVSDITVRNQGLAQGGEGGVGSGGFGGFGGSGGAGGAGGDGGTAFGGPGGAAPNFLGIAGSGGAAFGGSGAAGGAGGAGGSADGGEGIGGEGGDGIAFEAGTSVAHVKIINSGDSLGNFGGDADGGFGGIGGGGGTGGTGGFGGTAFAGNGGSADGIVGTGSVGGDAFGGFGGLGGDGGDGGSAFGNGAFAGAGGNGISFEAIADISHVRILNCGTAQGGDGGFAFAGFGGIGGNGGNGGDGGGGGTAFAGSGGSANGPGGVAGSGGEAFGGFGGNGGSGGDGGDADGGFGLAGNGGSGIVFDAGNNVSNVKLFNHDVVAGGNGGDNFHADGGIGGNGGNGGNGGSGGTAFGGNGGDANGGGGVAGNGGAAFGGFGGTGGNGGDGGSANGGTGVGGDGGTAISFANATAVSQVKLRNDSLILGGNGGNGFGGAGGIAGNGGNGGNGGDGGVAFGGSGGAAAGGTAGAGGAAFGGFGGSGGNGGNGGDAFGGNGFGGFGGDGIRFSAPTLNNIFVFNNGAIIGGNGGNGFGNFGGIAGIGGTGGAGGAGGIAFGGAGAPAGGSFPGGAGLAGANGVDGSAFDGLGFGGDGGAGVSFFATTSSNLFLNNVGFIAGGNGGLGDAFFGGADGNAGAGVNSGADNLTINNWGDIASGAGLNPTAILINASGNAINLRGWSTVEGLMNKNSGGADTDVLNFAFSGVSKADAAQLATDLAPFLTGAESTGAVLFRGNLYEWQNLVVELNLTYYRKLGLTHNQKAVGANLDKLGNIFVVPPDNIRFLLAQLDMSSNIPRSLDELSPQRYQLYGDIALSIMTFKTAAVNSRLNNLRDGSEPIDSLSAATMAPAGYSKDGKDKEMVRVEPGPNNKQFSLWAAGTGTFASVEGDGGDINDPREDLQDARYSSGGTMVGADAKLMDNLVVGILGDYTHTWANLDLEGSNAEVDTYGGAIYASWHSTHSWYVNVLGSYDHNEYDSERRVLFKGTDPFGFTEAGSTSGDQWGANIDVGYDIQIKKELSIGPLVALQYLHATVDSFAEQTELADGPCPGDPRARPFGAAPLRVDFEDLDSLNSRVGFRMNYHKKIHDGVALAVEARAAWQHEFLNDSRDITGQFVNFGLPAFKVRTTDPERDSALLGVGVNATFQNWITIFVDYDAQVGQENYVEQNIKGGVRFSF